MKTGKMMISNKVYDVLKYITQIFLPAAATLYFALAQIWGLPNAEEIVGSMAALDTFLGVLLGISSNAYRHSEARYDGQLEVQEDDDGKLYVLNLDTELDLYDLDQRNEITLKVGD